LIILQVLEDLDIEQFIAKFAVEAFVIAFLPRIARLNVGHLGSNRRDLFS
jgi:hypothetical protein